MSPSPQEKVGTPVERLLAQEVEWRELGPPDNPNDDLPYATHEGELDIGGFVFTCYTLSDGRRIFDAEDVKRWIAQCQDPRS